MASRTGTNPAAIAGDALDTLIDGYFHQRADGVIHVDFQTGQTRHSLIIVIVLQRMLFTVGNDEDTREVFTLVVQFRHDAFGEKLFDAPEMREIARLLAASERGLRWNVGAFATLRRALRGLGALRGSERVIRFLEVLQRLAQTPPEAELSSIAYGHSLTGLDSSRMETVTQYVRTRLYENVNQSEAAHVAGMSVASFRRFFQRTTRRTFPRFVNELRVSEVCRQLVSTDLTVTEILYRCGYSNQANFYRRFRQILGITPEQYRQSLQR